MNNKEKMDSADTQKSKEAIRTWLRLLSCETVIEQQLRSLLRSNFSVTLPQFDVLSELVDIERQRDRRDRPAGKKWLRDPHQGGPRSSHPVYRADGKRAQGI